MKTFKVIMLKTLKQEHIIEAKDFDEALAKARITLKALLS